jgi:hypothetical protein
MNTELPSWVKNNTPLDINHHSRLVVEADRLCYLAGIPKGALGEHLSDKCLVMEKAWLTKVQSHRKEGLAGFITFNTKHISVRFESLTAWCMRNHIDARVKSLTKFMEDPYTGEIVFIPYFYDKNNPPLAKWDAPTLLDMLVTRQLAGKITIIHIDGEGAMKSLKVAYGASFHSFLSDKFYTDKGC